MTVKRKCFEKLKEGYLMAQEARTTFKIYSSEIFLKKLALCVREKYAK
jgi:hypothetical protein